MAQLARRRHHLKCSIPHKTAVLAQLLLEWMDPFPLLALVAAAPLVPLVAAVHLTGWWGLRPCRLQYPLQHRLLLEEAL